MLLPARSLKGALDSIALSKVPPVEKPSWAANAFGDLKDLRAWEGTGRDRALALLFRTWLLQRLGEGRGLVISQADVISAVVGGNHFHQ